MQVSRFSAEFMKRKLAEAAGAGKTKSKKSKAKANAAGAGTGSTAASVPSLAGWATPAAAPAPGRSIANAPAMPPPMVAPAQAAAPVAAPMPAAAAAMPRYAGAASTAVRAAPPPAPSEFPTLGIAPGKGAKKDGDWEKVCSCVCGALGAWVCVCQQPVVKICSTCWSDDYMCTDMEFGPMEFGPTFWTANRCQASSYIT